MATKTRKTRRSMKCNRATCGYEWISKVASPKKCPRCQNSLWVPKGSDRPKAA